MASDLQLTFNKDGVYTAIPVVSSPIDIVNAITSPVQMPDEWSWWEILLAIVLLILLIVVLFPFLPNIIKLVVWIILLPFRLIKALIKGVKKTKRRNNAENP